MVQTRVYKKVTCLLSNFAIIFKNTSVKKGQLNDQDLTLSLSSINTDHDGLFNRVTSITLTAIFANSRGTKVGDRRILAPERYTAGFCMVTNVIPWCI